MSSMSPEKPKRRLAADPWARKLTIPEWRNLIIDRPRAAFFAGGLTGIIVLAIVQTSENWALAALFVVGVVGALEWKNRRDAKS